MRRIALISLTVMLMSIVGCGESPQASNAGTSEGTAASQDVPDFQAQRPTKQYTDPREAVNDFLVAVTAGEDKSATAILTTAAQREAWTNGLAISGEGFPDAQFAIKDVAYLNENQEAHVMTEWKNDSEYGGIQNTFQCVWMLRAEQHGWCIYGMATKLEMLTPPQPLVLNFENQSEMQKRQEWAQQEIIRQKQLQEQQAQARQQQPQGPQSQNPPATVRQGTNPQVPGRQAAAPTQTIR